MKKHYENFSLWIGKSKYADKGVHAILGLVIALISSIFFKDPWVCFGMAFTAGLAKEAYDHNYTKMTGSWLDWFATMAGGLIYVLFYFV